MGPKLLERAGTHLRVGISTQLTGLRSGLRGVQAQACQDWTETLLCQWMDGDVLSHSFRECKCGGECFIMTGRVSGATDNMADSGAWNHPEQRHRTGQKHEDEENGAGNSGAVTQSH